VVTSTDATGSAVLRAVLTIIAGRTGVTRGRAGARCRE
jgi:hypothetical protein